MTFALAETKSQETYPRLRPSWFQEWTNREFLAVMVKELESLLQGKSEAFSSDVAASTSVTEMVVQSDFWKEPFFCVEIKTNLATENETRVYEAPEQELLRFQESVSRASTISATSEDMLDWDAHIEVPPLPSHTGTIKVSFKYVGRSKPIPLNDPWA